MTRSVVVGREDSEEYALLTRCLMPSEIAKQKVREVLVEEKLNIAKELYLSITVDRTLRTPKRSWRVENPLHLAVSVATPQNSKLTVDYFLQSKCSNH